MESQSNVIPMDLPRQGFWAQFQAEYDWICAQPGITVTGWQKLAPQNIYVQATTHQTRTQTIVQGHKNKFKRDMEENGWGNFPPLTVEKAGIRGELRLVGGHHRHQAAKDALLADVPVFIIEAKTPKDMREFQQADNGRHKPALCHDENDMVKYLRQLEDDGEFNAVAGLDEKTKRDKIRELAHPLLTKHYAHNYSKRKRGGAITQFLNGKSPGIIKTWSSTEASDWLKNNNHLDSLGEYVEKKNKLDICTQAHTLGLALGIAIDKMTSHDQACLESGTHPAPPASVRIRVGVYVGSGNASSHEQLVAKRAECIATATRFNLDTAWTSLLFDELYFLPQSLRAPNAEANQPIVYRWDGSAGCYNLVKHV